MLSAHRPLARNLRHWRLTREMTLSSLAEQAGIAKSTVSLIEHGQGNPSIDTVWALAAALRVPFASLFHDEPLGDVLVVRRDKDPPIVLVEDERDSEQLVVRHLLTRPGGHLVEIYTLAFETGAVRHSPAHADGVFEHDTVTAGAIEISADSFSEIVRSGDLISFRADRKHRYRVIEGPVRLVSILEYMDDWNAAAEAD
ncbi:MAG TPA: helix-turn-helix domain-containing protein [Solirubrobacteraceae bacterium]|jgi:transcriptional regulator with XRE-family HTH domain